MRRDYVSQRTCNLNYLKLGLDLIFKINSIDRLNCLLDGINEMNVFSKEQTATIATVFLTLQIVHLYRFGKVC